MGRLTDIKERALVAAGTDQCVYIKNHDGSQCGKAPLKGELFCKSHKHGAPRPSQTGIYSSHLQGTISTLETTIAQDGMDDVLKKPGLEDELALARLLLMEMMADTSSGPKGKAVMLNLIAKIAKTAKEVAQVNATALRQEFLNSMIEAVIYAFASANKHVDPADRQAAFARELSTFFPEVEYEEEDKDKDEEGATIEGEYTEIDTEVDTATSVNDPATA